VALLISALALLLPMLLLLPLSAAAADAPVTFTVSVAEKNGLREVTYTITLAAETAVLNGGFFFCYDTQRLAVEGQMEQLEFADRAMLAANESTKGRIQIAFMKGSRIAPGTYPIATVTYRQTGSEAGTTWVEVTKMEEAGTGSSGRESKDYAQVKGGVKAPGWEGAPVITVNSQMTPVTPAPTTATTTATTATTAAGGTTTGTAGQSGSNGTGSTGQATAVTGDTSGGDGTTWSSDTTGSSKTRDDGSEISPAPPWQWWLPWVGLGVLILAGGVAALVLLARSRKGAVAASEETLWPEAAGEAEEAAVEEAAADEDEEPAEAADADADEESTEEPANEEDTP
jgi:hypothetical protein